MQRTFTVTSHIPDPHLPWQIDNPWANANRVNCEGSNRPSTSREEMREGLTPSEIWGRHWGYSEVKGEQAGVDAKLQRGRGGNECEHRKAASRREAGQRPENRHQLVKATAPRSSRASFLRHTGNPLVLVALLCTRVAAPCCPLQEWFRDRNRDRQSKTCPRTAIRRDGLKLQMEMWLLGQIGRGCNLR